MIEDQTNVGALMEHVLPKKPDLVEIRLDKLHDHGILEDIAARRVFPLIATDRSDRDQGSKLGQLAYAAGVGFDIIDLDLDIADLAMVKQMKATGARVILSFHDYSETPSKERLTEILEAEKRLGCDICKIVTTANAPSDNLTVLSFLVREVGTAKLVSFAMGRDGVPSRVLSPWLGAEFTFAALSDSSRTADGQLTIDELRSAWQILGFQ